MFPLGLLYNYCYTVFFIIQVIVTLQVIVTTNSFQQSLKLIIITIFLNIIIDTLLLENWYLLENETNQSIKEQLNI